MTEEKQVAERLIDFFEEHKGEVFSASELMEYFDVAMKILSEKLRKLIKHKEVEFERVSCKVARKIYKNDNLKRGMNLYFLE